MYDRLSPATFALPTPGKVWGPRHCTELGETHDWVRAGDLLSVFRYCSVPTFCEVLLATLPPLQSQFIIVEARAGNTPIDALLFFASCSLQRFLHL